MACAECQVVKAEDAVGTPRRQLWHGLEMQLPSPAPPTLRPASLIPPCSLPSPQQSQRQLQPASTTQQDLKREIKLLYISVLLNWLSVGEKPHFVTFASKFRDLSIPTMIDLVTKFLNI